MLWRDSLNLSSKEGGEHFGHKLIKGIFPGEGGVGGEPGGVWREFGAAFSLISSTQKNDDRGEGKKVSPQEGKGKIVGKMIARMVLGTGSGVGKSLVVAGMCRFAARLGVRVVPFKSQNMSNNSAVLSGGGEIARAQALQARACRVPPVAAMNPLLLKPMGEGRSQVIFMGQPLGVYTIAGYRELKRELFPRVAEIFSELASGYDLVILEGAGSPAEINLLSEDIANTRIARAVGAPALLLGDIEPGGVFAALYGTLALLPPEDRDVIRWLAINKFRGDASLLGPGMDRISHLTGRPFLGVIPHLGDLSLPDEDSFRPRTSGVSSPDDLRIVVFEWPHLSNRSDLDPFLFDRGVDLSFLPLSGPAPPLEGPGRPDAVVLPGTRQTISDLESLYRSPLHSWLQAYRRSGGAIVGICGGYQMMGSQIRDPLGVESSRSEISGLGFFSHQVLFREEKIARPVLARFRRPPFRGGQSHVDRALLGYEIRQGRSEGEDPREALFDLLDPGDGRFLEAEGRSDPDGRIFGSPVHGLFDDTDFRRAFYGLLRRGGIPDACLSESSREIDRALDRVADLLAREIDLEAFLFKEPPRPLPGGVSGDPFGG